MADSYYPQRDRRGGDSYYPPSPHRHANGDSYSRSDTYRPSANDSSPRANGRRNDNRRNDDRNEFTFRSEKQTNFGPYAVTAAEPAKRRNPRPRGPNPNRRGRGGFRPFMASERDMLRSAREITPERLTGMNEGTSKFKALEELSESETSMDLENEDASEAEEGEADDAPAAKRRRTEGDAKTSELNVAVPKWSNPDPYTALPPPDESKGKKKDVVQLIRKAKIAAAKEAQAINAVSANDDFISLNFEDGSAKDESSDAESSDEELLIANQKATLPLWRQNNAQPTTNSASITESRRTPVNASSLGVKQAITVQSTVSYTADHTTWIAPDADAQAKYDNRAPQNSKKRKRDNEITGEVIGEWQAKDRHASMPWCNIDHSNTEHMGQWLHKEIHDFYDFVKPHETENAVRQDIIIRLAAALQRKYPNSELRSFGSFASGLYLPTADMDLVLLSPEFRATGRPKYGQGYTWLSKAATHLERNGLVVKGSMTVIAKARVPILKFTEPKTGVKVDISFENMTGIVANGTFQQWKRQYPAMPIIVTLIKQVVLMRDLNEVYNGGIGGFSIVCLVVSLLQHMPAVQSGNMIPERNLGDILMNFLDLYGNKFNVNETGISMDPPGYFVNTMSQRDRIAIMDPNNRTNDISGGSGKILLIFKLFSEAYATLQKRMAILHNTPVASRRGASILSAIFAGDYSSFVAQRDILRQLHVKYGS